MPESWKPHSVGSEIKGENRAEALREWMTKSKRFKDTPFPMFFPISSLARDLSSAIFCIFWLKEVMYSMKLMTWVGGKKWRKYKGNFKITSYTLRKLNWTSKYNFQQIYKRISARIKTAIIIFPQPNLQRTEEGALCDKIKTDP